MQGTRCHLSPSYNLLICLHNNYKTKTCIDQAKHIRHCKNQWRKIRKRELWCHDVFYCIYAEIRILKLPQKYCWPSMNSWQSSCLFSFTPALRNQRQPRICGREFPPGKETLIQVTYWIMHDISSQLTS